MSEQTLDGAARPVNSKLIDLIGMRFGRLVVLGRDLSRYPASRGATSWWLCRCDCGTEKSVSRPCLILGQTRSCGCLAKDAGGHLNRRHGSRENPEYRIWCAVRERCFCSSHASYENYGGRGITICDRWQGPDGFLNFLDDMGPRPSPQHSIEREDNNGPYSPENCHWATDTEQGRNKRNNRMIEAFGETRCMAEWAEVYGMSQNNLRSRLNAGWSPEKALTTPVNHNKGPRRSQREASLRETTKPA